MGYNPQESLENTINTMGPLLGVHPIVPWQGRPVILEGNEPKKEIGVGGFEYIQGNPSYPPPPKAIPPPRKKGLIAGLIKGNQWLINPDHKALFLGRGS